MYDIDYSPNCMITIKITSEYRQYKEKRQSEGLKEGRM